MTKYLNSLKGEKATVGDGYKKYFKLEIYEDDGTIICARERTEVIQEEIDLCGYFVIVTSRQMTAEEALELYMSRDVSEKARRDCAGLSREWVRLYNEALYGSGHSAGNEGSAPGGAHDTPGSAGTARAGIQPDALAPPEDVLAHVRDFGGYCRKLEAGYRALITFYNDGGSRGRHTD